MVDKTERSRDLGVTLSTFGRFHILQTATALKKMGLLDRLYIADIAQEPTAIRGAVRRLPRLVHMACRAFAILKLSRAERSCWEAFDHWVARDLSSIPVISRIFHGMSLYCLSSLNAAKERGALTVVERAGSHISAQLALLQEERERWGFPESSSRHRAYEEAAERMTEEYEKADYILTCSEFARASFVAHGIPPGKVCSIHLGGNFECADVHRDPRAPFRLLCIGGEFVRKGIMYLLEAWEKLRIPNADLAILTFPPKGIRIDRAPSVIRLKPVPHAQLRAEYEKATAFCLPSVEDGFGMVVLEAMAMGLPVIVTTSVGASEVVRDGTDGFVVQPGNSEAIAAAVLKLYNDRELAGSMGAAARARADAFSWGRYAGSLSEWYSSIVLKPRIA